MCSSLSSACALGATRRGLAAVPGARPGWKMVACRLLSSGIQLFVPAGSCRAWLVLGLALGLGLRLGLGLGLGLGLRLRLRLGLDLGLGGEPAAAAPGLRPPGARPRPLSGSRR